jgi:hypothetical protein
MRRGNQVKRKRKEKEEGGNWKGEVGKGSKKGTRKSNEERGSERKG